jgi:hypothetical protein
MSAMTIVVTPELEELQLQIGGRPEEGTIQAFPSNRANEPFDEGMRERRVRHRLDFLHVKDAQVRLPLVELIQPIMVRAEVCREALRSRRSIEHPAQPPAIRDAAVHAEAHDATPTLVHHHEHPVCAQDGRFTSKQIEAPQTVLRVPEDREPRRPRGVWFRVVPHGENASHHILVHGNAEGQGDLLRDSWTPPRRIPLFHVDDGGHDVLTGQP